MAALCLALVFLAFLFAGNDAAADLRIAGSSTIMPIVKDAGRVFFERTGIRVHVTGGGSSVGVRDTAGRTADIGMVSRALHPGEAEHLNAHLIGHDGIAVIVNSANPVAKITSETVEQVFGGRIGKWEEIDGMTGDIVLVVKAHGRSTRELFDGYFGLKGIEVPGAHVIGSNAEAIVFVAGDPWAIGYVSVGTAQKAKARGVHLTLLELDGMPASVATVRQGRYPLRRPLNLVTAGTPGAEARRFLDFMTGPEGQAIVEKENFIRVSE